MQAKQQINIEYSRIEDRLLLRVSGQDSQGRYMEYRSWFTRLFVGIFIKTVDRVILDSLKADMQLSPDALNAIKNFQQEAALAKADFSTPYGTFAGSLTKFSEVPFLVTTIKIKKRSKNNFVLSLLTDENQGLNIAADLDMLHILREMILSTIAKTDWNQPLSGQTADEFTADGPVKYMS